MVLEPGAPAWRDWISRRLVLWAVAMVVAGDAFLVAVASLVEGRRAAALVRSIGALALFAVAAFAEMPKPWVEELS